MPQKRPTLQTIAELAGYSRMTVSRALRNEPCLPLKTREHIQKIGRRVGYRPDPKVSELMSYLRSNHKEESGETIALVHPLPSEYRNGYSTTERRMLEGVGKRAKELGFSIDRLEWPTVEYSMKRMRQIIHARGIRGVILMATRVCPSDLDKFVEPFSCSMIGRTNAPCAISQVCNDHYHTIRLTLEQLLKRGYRRIGLYIMSRIEETVAHAWSSIFSSHQYALGLREPALAHFPERWSREDLIDWVDEQQPDAVVTIHPEAREWLRESHPDIGYCNIDWSEELANSTGVDQNSEQVGSAAVDIVVRQIYCNETGVAPFRKTVLVSGDWVEGSTIAKRSKRVLEPVAF